MLVGASKSCDASYKRAVLLGCYDALAAVGFSRYKKEGVDWVITNGFHCWVGLNTGLYPEHVEITPFVGVHVVPIMRLYTSMEGRKYDRTVATYARHMGELAPEEKAYRFTPEETNLGAEAARLAQLYVNVGLEYARSIASYERLLPLLKERVDMLGGYPERTAACLYLMGRADEARVFAEEFLRANPKYFEGFAVPFLKMVNAGEQ